MEKEQPPISSELDAPMPSEKHIQAIDKNAVHRICSGQVVLTLGTAVKELIENSIDAGATSVDIRLKDYGSTLIEVIDNGSGVKSIDFQSLTLKHHTSKIKDFADVVGVQTFGFRGEALSSLCALSHLSVITRTSSDTTGTRILYNHDGFISEETPVSRQIGTTVILKDLFSTLPVRHKEFNRNLKKEFAKMTQILYSYCLISTGVRITCTNESEKGRKMTVASTCSSSDIKDNISSIFGAKQATSLMPIVQESVTEEAKEEYGLKQYDPCNIPFKLNGYISSCAHGQGRSSTDRQFFFINSRPCDPVKITKLINEVYHSYNRHQFPFVVINIRIDNEDVDVNVTPDKRQIFVNNEKLLLATIKSSIIRLYENVPNTYHLQNLNVSFDNSQLSPSLIRNNSTLSVDDSPVREGTRKLSLLERFSHSGLKSPSPSSQKRKNTLDSIFVSKQPKLDSFINREEETKNNNETIKTESDIDIKDEILEITPFEFENSDSENINQPQLNSSENNLILKDLENIKHEVSPLKKSISSPKRPKKNDITVNNFLENLRTKKIGAIKTENNSIMLNKPILLQPEIKENIPRLEQFSLNSQRESLLDDEMKHNSTNVDFEVDSVIYITDDDLPKTRRKNKMKVISISLEKIKLSLNKNNKSNKNKITNNFKAKINPGDNKTAEEELNRCITKESFKKMKILGQFNLGFIIAKLESDLFIIDQHATDEKYNFETLQQTCIIQHQKLISPQQLELTAASEAILVDNMEIFNKNGFIFNIDETQICGRRIGLTSIPHSKGWEFGPTDIEELIFMLSDAPGVMCRPSRIRAMFASRACRMSVMIGSSLSLKRMNKLVENMGDIEHPWNCPHGRPTMRHLVNLDMIALLST